MLSEEFIAQYNGKKPPFNQLGEFTFYRTYSRWVPELKRRELPQETFRRAVEYNTSLAPVESGEAEKLFDNMFNLKQFVSGRTLWMGGTKVGELYPMANFNCAFAVVDSMEVFEDAFYLLMLGTGFGHRELPEDVAKLPEIRKGISVCHKAFKPLKKAERLEETLLSADGGNLEIHIGDSKEGWVQSLKYYLEVFYKPELSHINTITFVYDSVRRKGERLKTFGGTASGHTSIKEMFTHIHQVMSNIPENKLRPVDVLDIMNVIGENVVVGGVRRTSEIGLGDAMDGDWAFAKYGINGRWTPEQEQAHTEAQQLFGGLLPNEFPQEKQYRRMSNNSVFYQVKPDRGVLHSQMILLKNEGEPCFVNAEAARMRRPNFNGVNPCVEILLDSRGLCNLTTVNVVAFIYWNEDHNCLDLDLHGLLEAQRLSARAGYRMTMIDLELPKWDAVHKRDRLCGVSLTGWQDSMDVLEFSPAQQARLLAKLREVARNAADEYAEKLGTPKSLLVTCVKPEGTLSLVAGGVSPGIHFSHAKHFIRRIRINTHDPLAKTAMSLGWNVEPEVGQTWEDARTLVIDFPVETTAKRTKYDVSAIEQLEIYKMFQKYYTEHNTSNTISVGDIEWDEVEQWLWDNWDDMVAVSFLKLDGHTYKLAPYETISEEKYTTMKNGMKEFTPEQLQRFEKQETEYEETEAACEGGACPLR